MHQNIPNYNSNTHFGPFWLSRGGLEGSKSNMALYGFFLAEIFRFFCKPPYIYPRYQVWGVMDLGFDFLVSPLDYHPPLPDAEIFSLQDSNVADF